jgi:DNA-binding beta-propeller fold protein YncE
MMTRILNRLAIAFFVGIGLCTQASVLCRAGELLVSDRLTNSVYRYSDSGTFLGTLLTDNVNLNQPSGLQLSPDNKQLYVASSQNNRVVRYDYNFATGTATNPTVFASDGLMFPNSVLFSKDGSKIYVSNLGGTGVAQFNTDGTSAGPAINGAIAGGSVFQFSGLAHAPSGELLVGGFQDFPAGAAGAIAKSNAAVSSISDFIAPSPTLNGTGNLLVVGNDLFATAGFAGRVNKYNATTGAVDASFNAPTNLAFPASMVRAPDGNGILVGILGFQDGTGNISRFGLDGTPLGVFAQASLTNGFREATGIVYVAIPEPATVGLLGVAALAFGWVARNRRTLHN